MWDFRIVLHLFYSIFTDPNRFIIILTSLGDSIETYSSYIIRAFSSTDSGFRSFLRSSHASQNRIFSSLYSHRRKDLNTFRPPGENKEISNNIDSIKAGLFQFNSSISFFIYSLTLTIHEVFEWFAPGIEFRNRHVPK